jgi:protein-L-isoaspartate O-methyltransferase
MTETQWRDCSRALADALRDAGAITSPEWHDAFAETPRHRFVPRFYAMDSFNSPRTLVDGANPEQREQWLNAIYHDRVLITGYEVVGRMEDGTEIRVSTSSASQPSVVAVMLERLDVRDGDRVLEIGTGTGYNAALLCRRVGDRNVTSIDIEPALVASAGDRLQRLGYSPRLEVRDGVSGVPQAAPYDRIVATGAYPGIPPSWIGQLETGGRIVAPMTFGGVLAVVTKTRPGEVTGRFDARQAWFMALRPDGQPASIGLHLDVPPEPPESVAHVGSTDIDPDTLSDPDFQIWLCLHIPGIQFVPTVTADGQQAGLVVHAGDSRAAVRYTVEGGQTSVVQDGRRLWDTVETARRSWDRHGRPGRDRLGITARADGVQRAWLDTPDSPLSWPIPATARGAADLPDAANVARQTVPWLARMRQRLRTYSPGGASAHVVRRPLSRLRGVRK